MPISAKNIENKPYNVCIDCAHLGRDCDGPNFLAMSTERWCEWCHLRKEYLDLTNAEIAEAAGIAEISVARVMSAHVKDIRVTTMQAVTRVLVNGTWGQYPCAMAAEEEHKENPAMAEQCKQLQASIEKLTSEHKAEIAEIRQFEQGRVEYLKEQVKFKKDQMRNKDQLLTERYSIIKQRNRVITILAVLLGITVAVIIGSLVFDLLHPGLGYFLQESLLSTK